MYICLHVKYSLLSEQESVPCERVIIGVILLVYVYTRHMQAKYTYSIGKNT